MRIQVLFMAILLLFTMAGCQQAEALAPIPKNETQPFKKPAPSSKFAAFDSIPVAPSEPDPDGVSFIGLGFAADGEYIMVRFSAPPIQSQLWQQDYIWVVDEKTKVVYKDIPVMPVVGPLIGRPASGEQSGYVMLKNWYIGVRSGSVVSVVLGKYKREHIAVP